MDSADASPRPSLLVLLFELTDSCDSPDSPPAAAAASDTAEAAASSECRGQRVPHEIRIASVTPQALAAMAEQPPEIAAVHRAEAASAVGGSVGRHRAGIFSPATPGLTHGMLHLMKDTGDWGSARPSVLVMLAVPAHMTVIDLAQFVADSGSELLEMKIIRDRSPGQFMVLLQFTDQAAADQFYSAKHGEPFSSLEAEPSSPAAWPTWPAWRTRVPRGAQFPVRELCAWTGLTSALKGILTILCNHSFHLRCLDKWHEASCPVCRYVATPQSSDGNSCSLCGDTDSLWICLICGYVGCGRYTGGHAYEHFRSTSHTFAMEVGTDRVWDYCGDNFVHRLVQTGRRQTRAGRPATWRASGSIYEEQLEQQAANLRETALQERGAAAPHHGRAGGGSTRAGRTGQAAWADEQRVQKLQKELDEERGFNSGMLANQRDLQERLQAEEARRVAGAAQKEEELEQLREEMRDLYAHLEADSSW
uniref:UBP-type domain-containing protein n=1 Tax=Macrostomum lignano TaxID=282301 RepID=A0A1I8FRV0_9PLAT